MKSLISSLSLSQWTIIFAAYCTPSLHCSPLVKATDIPSFLSPSPNSNHWFLSSPSPLIFPASFTIFPSESFLKKVEAEFVFVF